MLRIGFIVIFCLLFSCRDNPNSDATILENDVEVKQVDSIVDTKEKLDFSKPPISIKEYTLNDSLYWVTSSIIDAKYLDDFCVYMDYHLERGYHIIMKHNENIKNLLKVYVKDDKFQMNREKANEEFLSVEINNEFIKPWNTFRVGMSLDSLIPLISKSEYHSDYGTVDVYETEFTMNFTHKDSVVNKIYISRNCEN